MGRAKTRARWLAVMSIAGAMTTGCGSGTKNPTAVAGMAAMAGMAMNGADAAADVGGLGLTRVGTTEHYIVVLNVVPPEEMYMPSEAALQHPTGGEFILHGDMARIEPHSRHTEAHIYSKETGKPAVDVVPTILITDKTDGTTAQPEATLMQDVLIGTRDIHFGNNAVIKAGHEFTVTITIQNEEVSFSGRLS